MKNIASLVILAGISCALLSSCQKDTLPCGAPVPPPVSSLEIDCSTLPSDTKAGSCPINPAASFLAVWQGIYNSIINIPVRGFESVINVEPQNIDGTWVWENAYKTYSIRLVATESGNKYYWELQVAGASKYRTEYFTWITGWSKKNGSEGAWNILVGPDDTDVFITSEWEVRRDEMARVTLTCKVSHAIGTIGEFFNDSSITYLRGASDNAYDSTLDIVYCQIGLVPVEVTVEWNTKTGDCRVMSPLFYFDSKWHEWYEAQD